MGRISKEDESKLNTEIKRLLDQGKSYREIQELTIENLDLKSSNDRIKKIKNPKSAPIKPISAPIKKTKSAPKKKKKAQNAPIPKSAPIKPISAPIKDAMDLQQKYDFLLDSNATLLQENHKLQKEVKAQKFTPIVENTLEKIFQSYITQYRAKSKNNAKSAKILYEQLTGKEHPTSLTPPPKKPKMKKVRAT